MAFYAGIVPEVIAASLAEFKGVPHRIEEVAKIDGVLYINDSKGTNPASTIKALEAFNEPILLIAGGYDKKADFTEIAGLMVQKCKKLILMGKTRQQIEAAVLKAGFAPENSAAQAYAQANGLKYYPLYDGWELLRAAN